LPLSAEGFAGPHAKGVLLVAVGVREGGGFDVAGTGEEAFGGKQTEDYEELLYAAVAGEVLESVELIVMRRKLPAGGFSARADGCIQRRGISLCLATGFRHLEALAPPLSRGSNAQVPPGVSGGSGMRRTKVQARPVGQEIFVPLGAGAAPEMVQKFRRNGIIGVAFSLFPAPWRHRCGTTNLGEVWFSNTLRRYLRPAPRLPLTPNTARQVLGCFLLAAEQDAPLRSPMTRSNPKFNLQQKRLDSGPLFPGIE